MPELMEGNESPTWKEYYTIRCDCGKIVKVPLNGSVVVCDCGERYALEDDNAG